MSIYKTLASSFNGCLIGVFEEKTVRIINGHEDAEEAFQHAIAIFEEHLGCYHRQTTIAYSALGDLYCIPHDYIRAAEQYKKAIDGREKSLGKSEETADSFL